MMEWNLDDMMVAAAAETIEDGDVVLVGTGIAGCSISCETHPYSKYHNGF